MKSSNHAYGRTDRERYIDSMHTLGRIGTMGAIAILLGIPTVLGLLFDQLPDLGTVIRAALPLLIVFVPSSFFEVITYTPILGSSIYLTLITGEVLNIKLPVANNALRVMNAEPGSESSDIISSIAVCAATFVTLAVVSVGVVLSVPFQPLLSSHAVRIIASNILPAMLGCLLVSALRPSVGGGVMIRGRAKCAVAPALFVAALTLFDKQLSVLLHLDRLLGAEGKGVIMSTLQGFVIICTLPITYFSAKWLYRKKYVRVRLPDDADGI
ncbi:MAG: hypothetical protein LBC21_04855 [Oscillospiraceae bacterium]|jgi:hypothetical protein|nr:hypothetical protein [Oscillospiraceae bacterium]